MVNYCSGARVNPVLQLDREKGPFKPSLVGAKIRARVHVVHRLELKGRESLYSALRFPGCTHHLSFMPFFFSGFGTIYTPLFTLPGKSQIMESAIIYMQLLLISLLLLATYLSLKLRVSIAICFTNGL